jgi:hypothetical protein
MKKTKQAPVETPITEEPVVAAKKEYICQEGHTTVIDQDQHFVPAVVNTGDGRGDVIYQFCPHCFYRAAALSFPVRIKNG